jgi:hypothetical protein
MVDTRDLLLQRTRNAELYQFDVYLDLQREGEKHFYCHGLSAVDFASLFRRELQGKTVLLTAFSPDLLNSSYWEESTPAGEQAVRAQMEEAVRREDQGRTWIWRSDRVPKGRTLKDEVGLDPELLPGNVLSIRGEELARMAEALQPLRHDVRFVVLEGGGNHKAERARAAAEDARLLRRSMQEESIVYSSRGDSIAQVVLSDDLMLLKALEGAFRGFAHRVSKIHVAHINRSILQDLANHLDRTGALAYPHRDLVLKDTHFEITLHLAKSEWPAETEPAADRRVLVYYDRTSGIWALQV